MWIGHRIGDACVLKLYLALGLSPYSKTKSRFLKYLGDTWYHGPHWWHHEQEACQVHIRSGLHVELWIRTLHSDAAHQVAKLQSTGKETHDPISVIQCFPESQFLSIGTPSLRLWIRTKKKRIEMKIRRRRTPCPKVGPAWIKCPFAQGPAQHTGSRYRNYWPSMEGGL
jgi:hypothetical protein